MYFIYGTENYLINRKIKEIVQNKNLEPIVFDSFSSTEKLIMELSSIGFLQKERLIIVRNQNILKDKKNANLLIELLQSINPPELEVIFVQEGSKLDLKLKLVKWLTKNSDIHLLNQLKTYQIIPKIKEIVKSKKGTITNRGAIHLSLMLPNDLTIIISEIDKLLYENLTIDNQMIEISTSSYIKDSAFNLINAIVDGDTNKTIASYQEKIALGIEPVILISQIAATLNLVNLVYDYKETGLNLKGISEKTGIHVFRIKNANGLLAIKSIVKIKSLIIALAELDLNIKTGKIDKNKGLDRFILNLI